MNYILQNEIIKHIMFNLGIPPKLSGMNSLINPNFLLEKTIKIQNEDQVINNHLWGCDLIINQQTLKILLADCSQHLSKEYCLIIHCDNSPIYGLYYSCDQNEIDQKSFIAYKTINSDYWMRCNIFLQATLLAGMEQTKELFFSCKKCSQYELEYQTLISFINYYFNGEDDEG